MSSLQIRKKLFGVLFGGLLFAFTAYVLLDTFVIVRREETVQPVTAETAVILATEAKMSEPQEKTAEVMTAAVQSVETAAPTEPPEETATPETGGETEPTLINASASRTVTETAYQDENITVQITEYRISGTTVHVADVQLSSPEYLKTAFAENTYGRNVTAKVSETANAAGAILAINGDYYGARQSGYVIREGVLYRSKAAKNAVDLVIYSDGSFGIIREADVTAEELLQSGAWNVLNFGPALVENGEISVSVQDEVGRAMASNPRTAIAVIDELHYLFVVSDGRTADNEGLTLYELATFLKTLGASTAYNLDGGGSSTMVFNGTLINTPTSNGRSSKERSVSDIVYIGY